MEDKSFWESLSAEELIEQMFAHTDADGTLYMQSFFYTRDDAEENSLRCKLHWGVDGCEKVMNDYCTLRGQLEQLAAVYDRLGETEEENKRILSPELLNVWCTYLRGFETEGFDEAQMHELSDRLDTVEYTRQLARQFADGKPMSKEETDYLRDYMGQSVSSEELRHYDAYWDAIYADCKRRIGEKPYAFREIIHAKRLCKLMSLNAPKILLDNESRTLAMAMVLHRYCIEAEPVDNTVRVYFDRLERLSDDFDDDAFRPQRMNSRKSLAPLFVYLILKEHSDAEHHLKQQEILTHLCKYPYEIELERKALSRIIHNLADSQLKICTDAKEGSWYVCDAN